MKQMKKINPKMNAFRMIVLLLTIALALNICLCVFAFYEQNKKDEIDTDHLVYSLSNERYPYIMGQCYQLDLTEIEQDQNVYEFYCIAKYFENASMYKTYHGYDDTKAQMYQDEMNTYAQGITTFGYTIDEINGYFDIAA